MPSKTSHKSTKAFTPGDIYAIPDSPRATYYAAIARDGDILFFDIHSPFEKIAALDAIPFFLRLPVTTPSMRRAGWKKIGQLAIEGELAKFGQYLQTPAGTTTKLVYDNADGSTRPATSTDDGLEKLAVWDAGAHILPLLRYHFFREPTPFASMISATI